jgi:hypothetical protein
VLKANNLKSFFMTQTIADLQAALENPNNVLNNYWEEVGKGATMLDESILIHLN